MLVPLINGPRPLAGPIAYMSIIDLDLDLPPDENQIVGGLEFFAQGRGQKGVANYRYIFGPGKVRAIGLTLEELERMTQELSSIAVR